MDQHVMALCLARCHVKDFMRHDWPDDFHLDQRGGEAVISIKVPMVDPSGSFQS